jgi:hypothetical protein
MTPKAPNGHVLFARCPDPANTTSGKITIANLGKRGVMIGVVRYIDETIPAEKHICKPGDVIYCRETDPTGALRDDNGEDLIAIREQLVFCVVSDVRAEALTPSQKHAIVEELRAQQQAEAARAAITSSAVPPVLVAQ